MKMIVNGVECRKINNLPSKTNNKGGKDLYATIPLKWLHGLQGESGKVKVILLLWCLGGMAHGAWFKFGNNICKKYGVTPSQKNKILKLLETSGHIELKKDVGKTTKVKIVKPRGWN